MSSWSTWQWDGSQQVYYRARKGPQNKWQYEFSQPMNTTTIRDMGPQYTALPRGTALPIKAPSYLLQPNALSGGTPTALCADLTVFELEPRRTVSFPRREGMVPATKKATEQESRRTSLVVDKGGSGARKERRYQKKEGVTRVHDWRTNINRW